MKARKHDAPRAWDRRMSYQFLALDEILTDCDQRPASAEPSLINLCQGAPEFDITPYVRMELSAQDLAGVLAYGELKGRHSLREKLAALYQRQGVNVSPGRFLLTDGASGALVVALSTLLSPGDELIVAGVCFPPYCTLSRMVGARPVFAPLTEGDFRIDVRAVEKLISPRTRAILINSPSNPHGAVLARRDLEALVSLGIPIISDEVYAQLTYDEPACSLLDVSDKHYVIGSFSKGHAAAGLRVGYAVVPPQQLEAAVAVRAATNVATNEMAHVIAERILDRHDEILAAHRALLRSNRDVLVEVCREHALPLLLRPVAGFYALIDVRGYEQGSVELARELLHERGVAVCPSHDFGDPDPGFFRLNFARPEAQLREGVRRIAGHLQAKACRRPSPRAARAARPAPAPSPRAEAAADLVALLSRRAAEQPNDSVYLQATGDGAEASERLTFGELDRAARAVAVLLRERGAEGRPVLLSYPPGLAFMTAFWGCLYAGAIVVPALLPEARGDRALRRLEAIAADANPHCLLTAAASLDALRALSSHSPALGRLDVLATDALDAGSSDHFRAPALTRESLAWLQYTSGSTGEPRGVAVHHGNVLANCEYLAEGSRYSADSVAVLWAPVSHVAGLMYGVCMPVYRGFPAVHLSTREFMERPRRWLEAISRYRATHAGGPNFCYDLCVRAIEPRDCAGVSLASWLNAYNAAEPVRPDTLRRFAQAFAPLGFRPEAFQPAYGLSEATMRVAEAPPGRLSWRAGAIGYGPLERPGKRIRIVNPETLEPCGEGETGEIWVSGPDVAVGYWKRPEETERTFGARLAGEPERYLRTGDLGVQRDGELYIAGRAKELIIVRGVKYFPQDLEQEIEASTRRLGLERAAAFAVELDGEERLVVLAEVEPGAAERAPELFAAIQQALAVQVYDIVLVGRGALPRTASQKLQRGRCSALYQAGELEARARQKRQPAPGVAVSPERAAPEPPAARDADALQAWLREALSVRVGLPPASLEGHRPFAEYGLDSAGSISLIGALGTWLGRAISPTVLFDHPSIDALCRHLAALAAPAPARAVAPASRARSRAIAIVGMACRFPGGGGLSGYWRLLREGLDAVSEVPRSRWDVNAHYDAAPGVPGKTYSRWGGFIEGVELFDRELFGMPEAAAIDTDPQQRLLLEVAWEALEDASISAASLAGSLTGVFVGITQFDYARLSFAQLQRAGAYMATGTSQAIAANRLSYAFDWRGPSLSIDTACSSSLVALHQACRAIERGECTSALVGGVNLMLTPDKGIALSQGTFLSPDGKCRPFDARANGYVRGEGVGVVVLQPLEQALRDGHRIYAVVRGTAVNQDGKTNGLTAPSGLAQQEVLRAALDDAGLGPRDLGYVEAHGTGTALGDPIELGALAAALSSDGPRPVPCAIGAVKSNIGHLEAAAGIAGLIKAALCLHERTLVPTLHFERPNPHVALSELPLRVPVKAEPWPSEHPRVAGVSSFGFGGTNAHVILAEAPEGIVRERREPARDARQMLLLSAAQAPALRELARRYASFLASEPPSLVADICFTAAVGRSHLPHLCERLAVSASGSRELQRKLEAFAAGEPSEGAGVWAGRVAAGPTPRIGFVFSGQGAQQAGMGRELYEQQPVFREALDRCAEGLAQELERPLLSVLFGAGSDGALLDETAYTQPALFALGYALSELWASWGIRPAAVLGHSVGELTAACVAGSFDLQQGLRLVAARGRALSSLPRGGAMVAVRASEEAVANLVGDGGSELAIAAVNGPHSVVLSGSNERLTALVARLERAGMACRPLRVSHAFHSPLVEPALDAFEAAASQVRFAEPLRSTVISGLTGRAVSSEQLGSARHWRRHLREPVRFAEGMAALRAEARVVLDLGPASADVASLHQSLAALFVQHGIEVDWRRALGTPRSRRLFSLPSYAFQRQRYWIDGPEAPLPSEPAGTPTGHPLLGRRLDGPTPRYEVTL